MQNNDAAEFLLDYCAGKPLDPAQSAGVESHLMTCESCREWMAAQRSVWESLDLLEGVDVSPDFNRRLYSRIEADGRRWPIVRWAGMWAACWSPLSWRPAVTFAAVCATLVAALWIEAPAKHHATAQEPQAKIERVDVEQVERTLQDLEMLRQLNPRIAPETNSSSSM